VKDILAQRNAKGKASPVEICVKYFYEGDKEIDAGPWRLQRFIVPRLRTEKKI
jgi:hypothetical protein